MESLYYVMSFACHRRCKHCYDDRFRLYVRGELEAVVEQAQSSGHCASVVLELPGRGRMRIDHVSQIELAAALLGALAKTC